MQRENHKTVVEVFGTWCTKNDARTLFPVDTKGDKMTARRNQSSDKMYLFSDIIVCALSEAAFGKISASV